MEQPHPTVTKLTLTDDVRRAAIELFARGYTVRRIRLKLIEKFKAIPSDSMLMRLSVDYAGDIEQAREEIAQMALTRGLASKGERLLRLGEMAEEWEEKAKVEPRAAHIYLKTVGQIQGEVEPLGIQLHIPTSDPWFSLLSDLQEAAKQNTTRQKLLPQPSPQAPQPPQSEDEQSD